MTSRNFYIKNMLISLKKKKKEDFYKQTWLVIN